MSADADPTRPFAKAPAETGPESCEARVTALLGILDNQFGEDEVNEALERLLSEPTGELQNLPPALDELIKSMEKMPFSTEELKAAIAAAFDNRQEKE
jgi:hypothetical protein